jgi:predicted permease
MVLVAISTLILRDVQVLDTRDLEFQPDGVAAVRLNLAHGEYDNQTGRHFLAELSERLEGIPGVSGAANSTWLPVAERPWTQPVQPQGYEPAPDESPRAVYNTVTPGYFDLVGMPLMMGRDFTTEDNLDGSPVVIVNEAFARRFWPGQAPVGNTLRLGNGETSFEVVGVVRDARYSLSDLGTEERSPHIWVSSGQMYYPWVWVHVGTRGAQGPILASMRQAIRLLDEDLPVMQLGSMRGVIDRSLVGQRVGAGIFGSLGAVALFLAMLGIYGVLAFEVMDRHRELGVRLALGAKPGGVVAMVVTQSLKISSVGIAIGLLLSILACLGMRSFVIGVSMLDPLSLGGSVGLLALAAVVAALIPAVRAATVDPVQSLKSE